MIESVDPRALHLHTYFFFPFSVDTQVVKTNNPDFWPKNKRWLEGLDPFLRSRVTPGAQALVAALGHWQRDAYTRFDYDSPAYQDMVFFHPFMRRVFFDLQTPGSSNDEGLLRCYQLATPAESFLKLEAADSCGEQASVPLNELRLFLFANGMGILSLGVETRDISLDHALWINEMLRKVYPSSGNQIREGRFPSRMALVLERSGSSTTLAEEHFTKGDMIGVLPPLAQTILSLLYFIDYNREEYEAVLDERMVVYSYVAIDPASVPANYKESREYLVFLSRFLYVERAGKDFRYAPEFTRQAMARQLYTRWAHQGTYYGFTSYSSIAVTLGFAARDGASRHAPCVVHRMFSSRSYMMSLVALFYRSTLLDFAERTALISKTLYLDQWDGELRIESIRMTDGLRAEFLHFSSHWYFTELANKDEESEHFDLQCQQYRTEAMYRETAKELDALNDSLHSYHQFRNIEAVNRLGMLSMILGAGSVTTGFFGMNFQIEPFAETLLKGEPGFKWAPYLLVSGVTLISFGALLFGIFLIALNWSDYKDTLLPNRWRAAAVRPPRQKGNVRE